MLEDINHHPQVMGKVVKTFMVNLGLHQECLITHLKCQQSLNKTIKEAKHTPQWEGQDTGQHLGQDQEESESECIFQGHLHIVTTTTITTITTNSK